MPNQSSRPRISFRRQLRKIKRRSRKNPATENEVGGFEAPYCITPVRKPSHPFDLFLTSAFTLLASLSIETPALASSPSSLAVAFACSSGAVSPTANNLKSTRDSVFSIPLTPAARPRSPPSFLAADTLRVLRSV